MPSTPLSGKRFCGRCAPGLTPFVAKCCGGRPADVYFEMDTGERKNVPSKTGIHQGDALGAALFCMLLETTLGEGQYAAPVRAG